MKKQFQKKLKDILDGRIEPEETIEFLKTQADSDISDFFEKEDSSTLLEDYYSRNKDLGIVPDLSKKKEDELWNRISGEEEQARVYQQTDSMSGTLADRIREMFSFRREYWYGAVTMALLLLVIIPVGVFQTTREQVPSYHAMKGGQQSAGITFEIARMVEDNMLVRPEGPFTEEDMIAFQVKTDQAGYYAIYAVYGNATDIVICDVPATKGAHVVKTVYNPRGNKGENIFVMQFTQKKLEINESARMKMVKNAVGKSLSRIDIDGEPVFFKFKNIVVE